MQGIGDWKLTIKQEQEPLHSISECFLIWDQSFRNMVGMVFCGNRDI